MNISPFSFIRDILQVNISGKRPVGMASHRGGEKQYSRVKLLSVDTVWSVWSGQTRRCLFLGCLWVYKRSDCCSGTIREPRMLEMSWHCSSSNFVYKTPWSTLMWMVGFVIFVHKDLFPDKYLWSLTWEIHLKILQPTPWEPVSIVEVVNKVGAGAMSTHF